MPGWARVPLSGGCAIEALIRPLLIVFLLAAPALLQKLASLYFDDPYLQPLALTQEALAAQEERSGESAFIAVRVGWGRDYAGPLTQGRLRAELSGIMVHQTDRYFVDFDEVAGSGIGVGFRVGANAYGPYPPAQMARGLEAALIALRMARAAGPEGQ